jgi:hypothetical protein
MDLFKENVNECNIDLCNLHPSKKKNKIEIENESKLLGISPYWGM